MSKLKLSEIDPAAVQLLHARTADALAALRVEGVEEAANMTHRYGSLHSAIWALNDIQAQCSHIMEALDEADTTRHVE